MSRTPMPTIFLSHGAPPLADDPRWPGELAAWAGRLPRPEAILVVSAHWEEAPVTVSSTSGAPLVRDFWGFPARYLTVPYDHPPAPALAARVAELIGAPSGGVRQEQTRGLDHGAYVPLVEMYPEADVPVLQVSMPTLAPADLLGLGRALGPLRDEGVLLVGSGFTTHNLAWFGATAGRPDGADSPAPSTSVEFDAWAAAAVAAADVDALLDAAHRAPDFAGAHPRSEHWAPLYVALGAALGPGRDGGSFTPTSEIDGFWYGLSKRSWTFAADS